MAHEDLERLKQDHASGWAVDVTPNIVYITDERKKKYYIWLGCCRQTIKISACHG